MIFTRLGYVLIVTVIAIAAVAIFIVLRPESASGPPTISVEEVVNYSRYGVVESIEVKGQTMKVRFKDGYDTEEQFGTDSREFEASLAPDQSILVLLETAGIPVNTAEGVRVTIQ